MSKTDKGKVVKMVLKMVIKAGTAGPAPPVGPRIGQLGIPIMGFCKDFNEQSKHYLDGVPVGTIITAYEDRTYDLKLFTPPTSYFIKACAGVQKGTQNPGTEFVGKISPKMVYEIARFKKENDPRLTFHPLPGICRMVAGQCKSVGVKIE